MRSFIFPSFLRIEVLCLIFIMIFMVNKLNSQTYFNSYCPTVDSAQISYYNPPLPFGPVEDIYVKVAFNILRNNDGSSGYPIERIPILKEMMDDAFNPFGIYFFYKCDVNLIDSTYLRTNGLNFPSAQCDFENFNHIADYVNIYIAHGPNISSNVRGFASGIPGIWTVLGGPPTISEPYPAESPTLVHEIGHLFGLFHTSHGSQLRPDLYDEHSTFNYPDPPPFTRTFDCDSEEWILINGIECPETRTNGTVCGDYIYDTKPSHLNIERCNHLPDCNYNQDVERWNGHGICGTKPGEPFLYDPDGLLYEDPPINNFMATPSFHLCRDHFSQGQADVMRNFLSSHPMFGNIALSEEEYLAICPCKDDDFIVDQDLLIDTDIDFASNIVITNGAKLTVTGTIRMIPETHIFVERGSILDVNGGVITKRCDEFWGGVQVQGNSNKEQSINLNNLQSDENGVVQLRLNGKIEWAANAIQTRDDRIPWPQFADYYGGVILVDQGILKNNWRGVSFMAYDFPNKSNFDRLQVFVDQDYDGNPPIGVTVWRCTDLKFTRSFFKNLRLGIYGIDFDANIYNGNIFENCFFAIDFHGTHPFATNVIIGSEDPQITKNYFLNNMVSVRALGVNRGEGLLIKNNEFNKTQNYSFPNALNITNLIAGPSAYSVTHNAYANQTVGTRTVSTVSSKRNFIECNYFNNSQTIQYGRRGIEIFGDNEYLEFKYNNFDLLGNCCPDVLLRNSPNQQVGRINASVGFAGDPARNCFSYSGNEQIRTIGNTVTFDYWQPFQEMGPFCWFTTNNLSTGGTNNYYTQWTSYLNQDMCNQSGSLVPDNPDSLYQDLLSIVSELDNLSSYPDSTSWVVDSIWMLTQQKMLIEQKLTGIWWNERKFNSLVNLYDHESFNPRPQQLFGVYLAFGEWNLAQQTLDSIGAENPAEMAFKSVQTINLNYISSYGENLPDSSEISHLLSIATDSFPASFYAKSLLEKVGDHFFYPESLDTCIVDGARIINEPTDESEKAKEFSLIPNPAGDFVTMKFINDEEVGKGYIITDMTGRVVFKSKAAFSSGETIDISSFAAGIYIVKVLFDNGTTSTQKLIKL